DELRLELRAHALDPGRRPIVGPFDQVPGEQLVNHKPEREHVRLQHRPADGLLGRDITYRSRSGRLQRVLGHLRIPEIRQSELIIWKKNEVVRLYVTVYDVT